MNDASTNSDVWCSAVGNDANSGLLPSLPKRTVTNLFTSHTLSAGDVVYIDTGTYSNYTVLLTNSGTSGSPILFQGSTNYAAGGTVFNRNDSSFNVWTLSNSSHVVLSDLTLRGGASGVRFFSLTGAELRRVISQFNNSGFNLAASVSSSRFVRCVSMGNSFGIDGSAGAANNVWDSGVLWSNTTAIRNSQPVILSNSVIAGGTAFTGSNPTRMDTMVFWQSTLPSTADYMNDLEALSANYNRLVWGDPRLADPNGRDFHPLSVVGRFNPATGTLVTDAVHSILIDLGDPTRDFSVEPSPRGTAINVGSFGNHPEASLSRTNPWLYAMTFNDGGTLSSTTRLWWSYGGMTNGSTVRVQYSTNGGGAWMSIASAIPASNRTYLLAPTGLVSTLAGLWRVQDEALTNIWDACDAYIAIRASNTAALVAYVNDAFTNGDVYCTAPGATTNLGITPSQPRLTLQSLLDDYDFGPGDVIYIDSGTYPDAAIVGILDRGTTTAPLTLIGSTNGSAPTVINVAGGTGIRLQSASYVDVQNMTFARCAVGLDVVSSVSNRGAYLQFVSNTTAGLRLNSASGTRWIRSIFATNTLGLTVPGGTGNQMDQSLFWGNANAMTLNSASGLNISNSIVAQGNNAYTGSTAPITSDHVLYWNITFGGGFLNLYDYQKSRGGWGSSFGDPQFADPAALNFYLKSISGRYDPGTASFVTDLVHSAAIDFGNPAQPVGDEPPPNGSRINVGVSGGTALASRSRTNAFLYALSLQDGGQFTVGDTLYWNSLNIPTGGTVRIELSTDGGQSWTAVETNLAASLGQFTWTSTNFSSSSFGRWRVVYEADPAVASANGSNFVFRSGIFKYYVNDNSLDGDVFTTAVGNDTNLGSSAASPKASLTNLFATVDLEPGDIVYVDTGTYRPVATPVLGAADSGVATNYVILQFSTNRTAGGSQLGRSALSGDVFQFNGASYVEFRDAVIDSRAVGVSYSIGVRVDSSPGIRISGLLAAGVATPVRISSSASSVVHRSIFFQSGVDGVLVTNNGSVSIENSVFWRNGKAGISVMSGRASVSGSVVVASGPMTFAYESVTATNLAGNYNCIYAESNAVIGMVLSNEDAVDRLGEWQILTGRELNSLSVNPQFANPDALDFHLRSDVPEGRFDPAINAWVSDSSTSLLIDSGDPLAVYTNETTYNGGRVNIGLYGDTPQASRGRSTPWLHAATYEQGGWARGTVTLHWVAANFTNNSLVSVEFSPDGGETWSVLTNAILASTESMLWNTASTGDTWAGFWRVTSLSNTNVSDTNGAPFAIRNAGAHSFYINDGSSTGDVYSSGPGAATNLMATPARPYHSLAAALNLFDFEPGDKIYLDTGAYSEGAAATLSRHASGVSTNPICIQGPTNGHWARLDRMSSASGAIGLDVVDARWIAVSNLAFVGGNVGVRVRDSGNLQLAVQATGNAGDGFLLSRTTNVAVRRSVAAFNAGRGMVVQTNTGYSVDQSIIWSNTLGGVSYVSTDLRISNSVLLASGVGRYVYEIGATGNLFLANYNDVLATDGAQVALRSGLALKFLSSLRDATGADRKSLNHDPLFEDPAAGDFGLRSAAGRVAPGGIVVTDLVTSLLIDAADPARAFESEPAPNGARMNIGPFGDSHLASRSPTNSRLTALTLNDGGSVRGTNSLHWVVNGSATGHLLTIQFSNDGGLTWTNIATDVAASAEQYLNWDTTVHGSTPQGRWRLVSQSDSNVWDASDATFTMNNGALTYYVNDSSTNGDVYTTGTGSFGNDGLTPSTPVASAQDIFDRYVLSPGDTILIDTGVYSLNATLQFDQTATGSGTNLLVMRGSTNYAAGGTVLNASGLNPAISVSEASSVVIRHLRINGARVGIQLSGTSLCRIEDVHVEGGLGFSTPVQGIDLGANASQTVIVQRCSMAGITNGNAIRVNSASQIRVLDSVLWSNRVGIQATASGINLAISNSVITAYGSGAHALLLAQNTVVNSDYNNFFVTNDARLARVTRSLASSITGQNTIDSLAQWVRDTGRDRFSLSHDPGFANPTTRDFRLVSQGGRPLADGTIVTDLVTSVMIDAGNPAFAFTNEPSPNGLRVNLGTYGNTASASLTPTNGRLTAVSLNDGGIASGTTQVLYWVASGAVTGHLLRVDISYDDGFAWVLLASNVPGTVSTVRWDTTAWFTQPYVRWRVQSQNDSNIWDSCDRWFAIRNSNMTYYVNDGNLTGDVYCSAVGYEFNTGLSPSQPKGRLNDIFEIYDLEPGDTIYVDTGEYPETTRTLRSPDSGSLTDPVRIIGSTNVTAGGSRLRSRGLLVDNVLNVEIHNLMVAETNSVIPFGLRLSTSSNIFVSSFSVLGQAGHGYWVDFSADTRFERVTASGALTNGFFDDGLLTKLSHAVMWSNRVGVRAAGGTGNSALQLKHSVIGSLNSAQTALSASRTDAGLYSIGSDYNAIFVTNGAEVASLTVPQIQPRKFLTVSQWAINTGLDQHSLAFNPRFATPGSDYHLQSEAGRYVPALTNFVLDASTSWLIDAGDPTSVYTNEPSPNGDRINIGLHGNTAEASKTPTGAALRVVSLYDGGTISGTQLLYWITRGIATSYTVRLEYSGDAGQSWTVLATNQPATSTGYSWDTTAFVSTPLGLWRVIAEQAPAVSSTNVQPFIVRNQPLKYYVNDANVTGDIYCSVGGSATNLGVSPATPINSLPDLLARYDIEPGDTIYMDTGEYSNTARIVFTQLDSGDHSAGQYTVLQGSTNLMFGGTRILAASGLSGLEFDDVNGIRIRDLKIVGNGSSVVRVLDSQNLVFERVEASGGTDGFLLDGSRFITVRNSSSWNNSNAGLRVDGSRDNTWEFGVLWSNGNYAVDIGAQASVSISNSALSAFNVNRMLYRLGLEATLVSEYNALWTGAGALVAQIAVDPLINSIARQWNSAAKWARDTGNDRFSMVRDPLFADPANGDFHPMSQGGRYVPAAASFTNDPITSSLIDAGAPAIAPTNESALNGGRVNIGMYGNTIHASRSPTNPALRVVSLNDGGRAEGTQWPLYWIAQGAVTAHTVRLEVSVNTGATWSVIASGLPARVASPVFWDTTQQTSTVLALWRVVSEADPGIASTSDKPFAIRNQPISFFVNDAGIAGDVYSGAAGNPIHDGTSSNSPKDRLQDILDAYDLEPGDVVYIDTGTYILNNETVRWGRFDAWDDTHNLAPLAAGGVSVTLQGSTNALAGGAEFFAVQTSHALFMSNALGVAVRDISVRHGTVGQGTAIEINASRYASARGLLTRGGSVGIMVRSSRDVRISNTVARGAAFAGIRTLTANGTIIQNCVLWSNLYGVAQDDAAGANLTVENTVFGIYGSGAYGIFRTSLGSISSDYNCFYRENGGFAAGVSAGGSLGGGLRRYETLTSWVNATGRDTHSLASDPKFAGPDDFHPQSPVGRFLVGTGYITNIADAASPLIDAGNPASAYSLETAPNGSRVNIGAYGHTRESSLSPTNGQLTVITFNDGGSGSDEIVLRWVASGAAQGHFVTLEFSSNGGTTWTNIATNVLASNGSYVWDSVPYGRAAAGMWRITSQSDPTIADETDRFFALRNGGSIPYYVNDGNTAGDVYSTEVGNDDNDGFLPDSPKLTLEGLLNAIDLEPGDLVYVDTGEYLLSGTVQIGDLDAGTTNARVVIQGSTNWAAGGTVFNRQTGLGKAIEIYQTEGIELRDFRVINGAIGISLLQADGCVLRGIRSENNSSTAFLSQQVGSNVLINCLAANTQIGLQTEQGTINWINGVIWNVSAPVNMTSGGGIYTLNSLFQAVGAQSRVYNLDQTGGSIGANYNVYYLLDGALMYEKEDEFGKKNDIYTRLADWQRVSGQDMRSMVVDPLLANPAAGDYHPRSATGRFLNNGTLTNDAAGVYSVLMDIGDPSFSSTNEPPPNGGRINVGLYGGTTYASMSRTNPWLLAVSFNDGGTISGTVSVYWAYGNLNSTNKVRLEYALDGVDFLPFATNVPISAATQAWDVSGFSYTRFARWRVVCQACGDAVLDQNDTPITIKNQSLLVYVNDSNPAGDVFTSAPGHPTNSGTSTSAPMMDPVEALKRYELGPGDALYIDTGVYQLADPNGMVLGLVSNTFERGDIDFPIQLIGSTNYIDGGSQILGVVASNSYALKLLSTRYVEVRDLIFAGAGSGVFVESSPDVTFTGVRVEKNTGDGMTVALSNPVYVDRSVFWSNGFYGLRASSQSDVLVKRSVLWGNTLGAVQLRTSSGGSFSNSLLGTSGSNRFVVLAQTLGRPRGDYNLFWPSGGALLGRNDANGVTMRSLSAWQNAWLSDYGSLVLDPDFVNAAQGNFVLKSQQGRYVPETGGTTTDGSTSWAIDAGDPLAEFADEPEPNGSRINLGPDGNSPRASRSVTNAALRSLQVVSYEDGGQMKEASPLRWLSRGFASNETIRIEYSVDNGATWRVLETNQPAVQQSYFWSPDPTNSSPVARWRIISEDDPGITSSNSTHFALRLQPVTFYINDTNTVGDMYSDVGGSATNNGLSPVTPNTSLQAVLDMYDLEQGDEVLIDTGFYVLSNKVRIVSDDSGNATNSVRFRGSTNHLSGGTVFQFNEAGTNAVGIEVFNSGGFEISGLTLVGAYTGFKAENANNLAVSNLMIRDGGGDGFLFQNSSQGILVERSVVTRQQGAGLRVDASTLSLRDSVIWSNQGSAVVVGAGTLGVTNSVLHAFGASYIYDIGVGTLRADYNCLFKEDVLLPIRLNGVDVEGLLQWNQLQGQDRNSVAVDPLFNNPAALDFHPRSPTGRFDPLLLTFVQTNEPFSALVDTAAWQAPYTNEPAPNGGRRNIGLHGDTPEASKGRTNAWVMALTGSAGGRADSVLVLTWAWGMMDPTNTVSLAYSYDAGTNWLMIASNYLVSAGQYVWDTALEPLSVSPIARWGLWVDADTNVSDITDNTFALNGPFSFYVNDDSLVGDVFCTAIGSSNNLGIFPTIPQSSLGGILDIWDLEGGDTVYVDTGLYPFNTNSVLPTIVASDGGTPGLPVNIRGSSATNGTRFVWADAEPGQVLVTLRANYMRFHNFAFNVGGIQSAGTNLTMYNLVISNAHSVLGGSSAVISNVVVTRGSIQTTGQGLDIQRMTVTDASLTLGGGGILFRNSIVYGTQSVAATISGTNISLINNSIIGRRNAVVVDGVDASLTLRNNILIADAQNGEAYVLRINSGSLVSDYNNLVARNDAWIGTANGKWERLLYWQRASGQDANSVSVDPLFADESGADFHVKSIAGRFLGTGFVNDVVHSPMIDLGSPSSSFAGESPPNGGRVNLGAYGNTAEASRSLLTPWLFVMTMNDGGVIKSNQLIRWTTGNLTNGATVTLRYSSNGGLTWTNFASGLDAAAGQYDWDSTGVPSSLNALWGIVLDADTNVSDVSDSIFAVRNTPLNFYVNDSSTNGDVYVTAVGHATNNGLTASTPMRWVSDLLRVYDTEGGDVIYVDTGLYALTQNVTVIWSRGGDADAGPLWIWGSTNFQEGGSVFARNSTAGDTAALDVKASHVRVRNMTLRNGQIGALLDSNANVTLERNLMVSNTIGVVARNTFRPYVANNRISFNSTSGVSLVQSISNTVENNTFHNNARAGITLTNSLPNIFQNNIFVIGHTGAVAYVGNLNDAFVDYNVYFFRTNAVAIAGTQSNLLTWQLATARDYRSAVTNPLFADLESADYHLQSSLGRWVDGFGFTTDVQTSWAVDRGATNSVYAQEPLPNGARINIGAYGNTEYASKGLINTQILVETRILNTPTFIRETNSIWPLIWSTINVPTTELFNVQFSGDGGVSWYTISNNVPAYQEVIVWQANPFFNTYRGYWRIVGVNDTNYWDVNDAQFQLFFGTFRISQVFYDQDTNGIVFRGAWDEQYQVQWATNVVSSNYVWWNAVDGTGLQERASFLSTNGGDFIYRDRESTNRRFRLYRVLQQQMEP